MSPGTALSVPAVLSAALSAAVPADAMDVGAGLPAGAPGPGPLAALGLALLAWPLPVVRARWAGRRTAGQPAGGWPTGKWPAGGWRTGGPGLPVLARAVLDALVAAPAPVQLGMAGLVGGLAAGGGGVAAGVLLGLVVRRAWCAAGRTRQEADHAGALAEALAAFATELRAGAPPAAAARAAGADARGPTARALRLVEATARLGGEVPAALRADAAPGAAGDGLRRLADAWALAERHGIGLAGLAGAVAVDLDARARFAARTRAQVAGPRATAVVLAVLPVLGLVLGEAMGAAPWAVLTGSTPGQVLLVVGVALVGAGLEWTERIVAGVTR